VAACEIADHSQHEQPQHVVDDRGGEDDLAGASLDEAAAGEHLGSDTDAGGHHGCAGEDRFHVWLAPEPHNPPAQKKRRDHAEDGDRGGRSANAQQLLRLHFEAHAEQQEHHSELRERVQERGGGDPTERGRTDQHSGDNLAHDAGLLQPLEQFGQKFGRAENH
jgi:hypothetical protein